MGLTFISCIILTASLCETAKIPHRSRTLEPTTTIRPCTPITITDTWAGQCCNGVCRHIFCNADEIIDTWTCRPEGMLQDCRCIPRSATTTPGPTTNQPCTPITINDTWAGQCCNGVCGHVSCNDDEIIDRWTCRPEGMLQDCRCIPRSATTTPGPTTNQPCTPITITDTWAGQCCNGVCRHIFCNADEIIDTWTCRPEGMLQDCRCIPRSATTTPGPTTNQPCTPITINDTWAGQCCNGVCGHVSCNDDEIIDRWTCRPEGMLQDCRCIPRSVTTTPGPTTNPPCTPITITDTWAGQCCNGVCADVFCTDNEIIDRWTCTPDGRLQDCRCIPRSVTTTTVRPTTDHNCAPITISDSWAGQCCNGVCGSVFCFDNEIIDISTCTPDGLLRDCRCISA